MAIWYPPGKPCRGGLSLSDHTFEVIVAGDLFVDLIMSGFSAWPQPGTEAVAKEFRRELGGGAAITACGLARLGSSAAILSVVGQDEAEWVANRLKSCGVITSELRVDPDEMTACSVAISTPEERTFFTYEGANRRFPRALAGASTAGVFGRTRHVHLGWAPPLDSAAELFAAIRRGGCTVSLDTGWHENWLADPRALELLPMIDIFFPNESEAVRMTGETDPVSCLRKLEMSGATGVALKLGANGAALLWSGEILRVQPCTVQAVDTIGAGDSFDAGFLHYWLRGESPLTCLRAANFCGAASTEAHGGLVAFPDAGRVENVINEQLCEK